MKKIDQLKELVQNGGTEKMKELVTITEEYLKGLDHMFKNRDVDKSFLREFDFPMFLGELKKKEFLRTKVESKFNY